MEGSNQRLRGAIRGGETLLEVEGSNVEGSDKPDRGGEAIRGGGELSEMEESSQKWNGTLEGGGELSEV